MMSSRKRHLSGGGDDDKVELKKKKPKTQELAFLPVVEKLSPYTSFLQHKDPLRFIQESPKTLLKVGFTPQDDANYDFYDYFIIMMDLLEKECLDNSGGGSGYSGFYNNRAKLLKSFCRGDFYFLELSELDADFVSFSSSPLWESFSVLKQDMFVGGLPANLSKKYFLDPIMGSLLMPCFCALSPRGDVDGIMDVDYLWVHPKFRRLGLGQCLIQSLGVQHVDLILEDSLPFWKSLGVSFNRVL
jgi:hypothetical protein